jgi:RNA polymerase sigma-70 factor (ECF subfamily)
MTAPVESLFRDHGPAVLGYLARRVDVPADAADLLSETMLVAWRRQQDVPSPPADRPWLFGVARNVLANHRRSTRRRTAATQALAETLRHPPPSTPSAAALDIRHSLAQLEELDREIVTLSAWEGFTSGEISQIVGIPSSTVRARLARARATLRARLTDTAGVAR